MYSRLIDQPNWKGHVKKMKGLNDFTYQGTNVEDKMGIDEIKYFCGKLSNNKFTQSINLDNNNLDDKCLLKLAKVLKKNRTVTSISLKFNPKITQEGIKKFLSKIQKNETLTEVIFDYVDESLNNFLEQNKIKQATKPAQQLQSPKLTRYKSPKATRKLSALFFSKAETRPTSPKVKRSYKDGAESIQCSSEIEKNLTPAAKELITHRGALHFKNDQYKKVGKVIGKGAFATVYKGTLCKGTLDNTKVAVKVIKLADTFTGLTYQESAKMISSEIEILVKLAEGNDQRKQNIIKLVAICTNDHKEVKRPFILVFEFANQSSLDHFLKKAQEKEPLDADTSKQGWHTLFNFIRDIANGLAYIHGKNIVHCDIKPQNILITNGVAKIADFGISVDKSKAHHQLSGGTKGYIPPEGAIVNPKWDVYSFSVTINELVWYAQTSFSPSRFDSKEAATGKRPEISEICPEALKNLIKESWDGNPASRPSSEDIATQLSDKHSFFNSKTSSKPEINEEVDEVKRPTNG